MLLCVTLRNCARVCLSLHLHERETRERAANRDRQSSREEGMEGGRREEEREGGRARGSERARERARDEVKEGGRRDEVREGVREG